MKWVNRSIFPEIALSVITCAMLVVSSGGMAIANVLGGIAAARASPAPPDVPVSGIVSTEPIVYRSNVAELHVLSDQNRIRQIVRWESVLLRARIDQVTVMTYGQFLRASANREGRRLDTSDQRVIYVIGSKNVHWGEITNGSQTRVIDAASGDELVASATGTGLTQRALSKVRREYNTGDAWYMVVSDAPTNFNYYNFFAYCYYPDLALTSGAGSWVAFYALRGQVTEYIELGFTAGNYSGAPYKGVFVQDYYYQDGAAHVSFYKISSDDNATYSFNTAVEESNHQYNDIYINGVEKLTGLYQVTGSVSDGEVTWLSQESDSSTPINDFTSGSNCDQMSTLSQGQPQYVNWPGPGNNAIETGSSLPTGSGASFKYTAPSGNPTFTLTD